MRDNSTFLSKVKKHDSFVKRGLKSGDSLVSNQVKQRFVLRQCIAINDDVEIIVGVFISNRKKGKESKIAERQSESVCVRQSIAGRGTERRK